MTRNALAASLLAAAVAACHTATPTAAPRATRYLVTETPISVGVAPGLCIAVNVLDSEGVWWWEPGTTGCTSRSTGPGVFHPDSPSVARTTLGTPATVRFRLGTHSFERPFIDVNLVVEGETMRVAGSDVRVSLLERRDLEVPERCCEP